MASAVDAADRRSASGLKGERILQGRSLTFAEATVGLKAGNFGSRAVS